MKKRWIAVLLCAALLAAFGWGQPRISGEGETYDLYFLEADLSDAPGGDALRAEPLYIESGEVRDTRELAEYLGVHQTTYSDYELGRLNVPLHTLCRIADFYGVSTDYLLRRTSNPEPYK